nr:2095_t:CDS:2 [Entrophospora candida]
MTSLNDQKFIIARIELHLAYFLHPKYHGSLDLDYDSLRVLPSLGG